MFLRSILNNNKTAQALAELTLFGSFFIMLLAVTVSYSMRYNSQQRTSQEAFRKGITQLSDYATDEPVSTPAITYTRYRDDYVPDPANPFGLGSLNPAASSVTLTRDFRMHMSADADYSLPQFAVDIDGINRTVVHTDGSESRPCNSYLNTAYRDSGDELGAKYGSPDSPCYYLIAGFRVDEGVSKDEETFDRYTQVYGAGSLVGCNDYNRTDNSCSEWMPLYEWDDEDGWEVNGDLNNPFSLRMIDSSGGEIMEYGSTVSQCRRIVDIDVCADECNEGKSKDSDTDCAAICAKTMGIPWYCADYEEVDSETHRYKFPVLARLFGINPEEWGYAQGNPAPRRTLGVQTDYVQQSEKDGTADYVNEESSRGALNSMDLSSGWSDIMRRQTIIIPYRPNRDSADEDGDGEEDLTVKDIDNTVKPDPGSSFIWETAR